MNTLIINIGTAFILMALIAIIIWSAVKRIKGFRLTGSIYDKAVVIVNVIFSVLLVLVIAWISVVYIINMLF